MQNLSIFFLIALMFLTLFFTFRKRRKIDYTLIKKAVWIRFPFITLDFSHNSKYVFVVICFFHCGKEITLKNKCKIDDFNKDFVINTIKEKLNEI